MKPIIFIIITITIIIMIINIVSTNSIPSSYNHNNDKNITLYGDSILVTNTTTNTTYITLTTQQFSSIGAAFYSTPLRFLDSKTDSPLSFSTFFSFIISPVSDPGEGFSFLVTSNVGSFNQENGHLGLPELSFSEHDSFFAVEFDTKFDPFVNDINGNHVGVDVDSYSSLVSVDGYSIGVNFSSGKRVFAWIEYKQLDKLINVWVSYSVYKPKNPAISAQIDLSDHLKEFMYVGFVASNGKVSAFHVLDSWKFKTFESDFISSEMIPEIDEIDGCIICNREISENYDVNDSIVDVKGGKKGLITAIGVTIAIVLCFSAALVGILIWKPVRRVKKNEIDLIPRIRLKKGPIKLSLSEMKLATNGFSRNRIIGQGASSTVYKGVFGDDQIVAVKRFNCVNAVDDAVTPFTTEFSAMSRSLRHENLVQLLGWCCERNELILVYEFLPNGSLDQILYENSESISVSLLTWEQRMNIVLGIASALTYLHEECDRQIIHRDVKACNVMLDSDFTPKLGDFGLAEVYNRGSKSRKSTVPAGTLGYLAPEYVYSGVPTVKSDVYSFGVMVLEVVSGKRAVEEDGPGLVDWVWALWENGRLIEAVDGRLKGKYSRREMLRMLKVGLCCVNPDSKERPTAKEAAMMLKEELRIPSLPAKKPNLELRNVDLDDAPQRMVDDVSESPWLTPKTHFGSD
ncbi:hypothetical protein RND81_03G068800 [Saponaria officinalis]|uniref:non-specific serine/threonine protein kinase n=1 Tax=Saponaria officinalis TaxID=3572 RepID=A0AAW1M5D2_SAPOF